MGLFSERERMKKRAQFPKPKLYFRLSHIFFRPGKQVPLRNIKKKTHILNERVLCIYELYKNVWRHACINLIPLFSLLNSNMQTHCTYVVYVCV